MFARNEAINTGYQLAQGTLNLRFQESVLVVPPIPTHRDGIANLNRKKIDVSKQMSLHVEGSRLEGIFKGGDLYCSR